MSEVPAGSPPKPDGSLPAGMLAVLVADVRGYTAFTHQRGDVAGARPAARFAELAEVVIREAAGTLAEVRGDEVLAVFVSARAALSSAVTLLGRCATSGRRGSGRRRAGERAGRLPR